jgi:UDP-N-acetylmuramyl pentapeptide synthase
VRGLAAEIIAGAGEQGISETAFFESSEDAAAAAIGAAREGDLILVKGSRSVETDRIVTALRERFPLTSAER